MKKKDEIWGRRNEKEGQNEGIKTNKFSNSIIKTATSIFRLVNYGKPFLLDFYLDLDVPFQIYKVK